MHELCESQGVQLPQAETQDKSCRHLPWNHLQIGFRPVIHDNTLLHITDDQSEMPQLSVDDIIITVRCLSPDTQETQHIYRHELDTLQSMGSDDMPLHRYKLGHPQHMKTIPRDNTLSTDLYNELSEFGVSTMECVLRKRAITERRTNPCRLAQAGLGIPQDVQTSTAIW
jgi:hypothetical protein